MPQQMTEPQTSEAACSGQIRVTAQGFLFPNPSVDTATLYENLFTIQNAADTWEMDHEKSHCNQ
jgi:hypothetical protein